MKFRQFRQFATKPKGETSGSLCSGRIGSDRPLLRRVFCPPLGGRRELRDLQFLKRFLGATYSFSIALEERCRFLEIDGVPFGKYVSEDGNK